MKTKQKPIRADDPLVLKLLAALIPVPGEMRVAYQCDDCGRPFARRFIPYGLGHGQSVGMCLCQVTAHRPSTIIIECNP